MATFQSARKTQARLRLALAGPPGAGKTFTALLIATELADGGTIALIDTEHGSASKYGDRFAFDVLNLETFHPQNYLDGIRAAEEAGYAVLIIDSLSHAWTGAGGVLEEKDRIAKTKHGGNSFNAWRDAGALQNDFIGGILGAKLHVIATMRSKTEYVVEQNERGRSAPRKVGLAPVQRDDVAYEFDIMMALDVENQGVVEKSRCSELAGKVINRPGTEFARTIRDWLAGDPAPTPVPAPAPVQKLSPAQVVEESLRIAKTSGAEQQSLTDPPPVEKKSTAPAWGLNDIILAMNTLATERDRAGHDVNTTLLIKAECLTALGLEGPISDLPDKALKRIASWVSEQSDALIPTEAA